MRNGNLSCVVFTAVLLAAGMSKASVKPGNPIRKALISDGWYAGTVSYGGQVTFTKQSYPIRVKVGNGQITSLDFGNGQAVTLLNNKEGYSCSGGTVAIEINQTGSSIKANATVLLTDKNGTAPLEIYF